MNKESQKESDEEFFREHGISDHMNEFEKAKKQLQAKGINVFGKPNELVKEGMSS